MIRAKVTSKYQVVIPKKIRETLQLKPGQYLQAYRIPDGVILTTEKKWPDDYIGLHREVWRDVDITEYLENERNSWD